MLEKFMHKINDALEVAVKKDKKRILDSAKSLGNENIVYAKEVEEFMVKHNMSEEKRVLFLSELKKFHIYGKTILKLDIGIGGISTYQERVKVTE